MQRDSQQPQSAWYWVKVGAAPWEPSTLSSDGHPNLVKNGKTYELGPRIPTPDEPWQSVPTQADANMLEATGYETSPEADGAWQDVLAATPEP